MNEMFAATWELQQFCDERHWTFCFIRGVAAQRWGEPRFTAAADMTLPAGFGAEKKFASGLLEKFPPPRPEAADFAVNDRVLRWLSSCQFFLALAFGAMARQWGKLNLNLIRTELKPLIELQDRPERLTKREQKTGARAQFQKP